jgi:hypothetical protein
MSTANPSTFLELCQATASETGVSLTGPADTTTQTGRLGQIVNWVQRSWLDIQTKYNDWSFMRFGFTLSTTADDGEYAYTDATDSGTGIAIAAFRDWCRDTPMKIYLTSAGVGTETDLEFMEYADWYNRYNFGTQTSGYPAHWTRSPSGTLLLGQKPNGIYTVSGDFMRAATVLSGDSDTPELPAEYHMAIVYRAMMKYGRYNAAPEVFTDGQAEYTRMMREMSRTQRPRDLVGGPLA